MRKWMFGLLAALLLAAGANAAVIPMGQSVGIELTLRGVLVVGTERADGQIRSGDLITAVDGAQIDSTAALSAAVQGKMRVTLALRRGGETRTVQVCTAETAEGRRLGLLVRDSMTGIGTMTYYDTETGAFGALGHGVSDDSGAQLLPLAGGRIVRATITQIERGAKGAPGKLCGGFADEQTLGVVEKNTRYGVFGHLDAPPDGDAAALGRAQLGEAALLCDVEDGGVRAYAVRIDAIEDGRFRLTVTDDALKRRTGGIVQGMSGSPIMQNGKLVGAVTHVLVNDPTKGYGIFIRNMLEAAG